MMIVVRDNAQTLNDVSSGYLCDRQVLGIRWLLRVLPTSSLQHDCRDIMVEWIIMTILRTIFLNDLETIPKSIVAATERGNI